MKRRVLGRSGIEVTELGVGAWQLAGPLRLDGLADGHPDVGRGHAVELIRRCGDELGINLIDTAEQYGAGEGERRVGEALAGRRDRWVVCTKFGATVGPRGERVSDTSARRAPLALEGSLRRLRTDYLDVYLYHVPPDRDQAEGVAAFLEEAKRKGQVRAVGISTDGRLDDTQFLHSIGCCDVVQFPKNLIHPQAEIIAFVARHNLGAIVRGAFAAGRLTGAYFHKPPAFHRDDIRATWFADPGAAGREFGRYRVFQELVTPNRTMDQLALRWLLDDATTHTVLLGSKDFDAYRTAAAATELPPLTEAERRRVDDLWARLAAGQP